MESDGQGAIHRPDVDEAICISYRDYAELRMNILNFLLARQRRDAPTMIGDIISTYLEEVEEYIRTIPDQNSHQQVVPVTVERMLTENILVPLFPAHCTALWESTQVRVELK